MSAENPPTYNFSGIDFNPSFYVDESNSSGITQEQANALYLQKTIPDTATALETFSAGISATTVSATGDLSGATVTASGVITGATLECTTIKCNTYQSKSINQPLTLGNNQTSPDARMDIGNNIGRNANINIATIQTSGTGNIVIGSTALTSGSQDIIINRPLTIGYNAINNLNDTFNKIGSYNSVYSTEATIVNDIASATSLVNFTDVPSGIYLFNYQINYRITVVNTVFTQQKFILSTTENNFVTGNIIGGEFSSLFKTNQEVVVLSAPTTDYTQTNSKCGTIVLNGTSNIYLNYRIVHNISTTVPYIKGSLRLVRIG